MFWLDLVNEAFEWSDIAAVRKSLSPHVETSTADCQFVWETMVFIREQMSAAHFGNALDADDINRRLATIRLEYSSGNDRVPPLHPQRAEQSAAEQFAQTVFLQAMIYLSEFEQLPAERRLKRCESVYRAENHVKKSDAEVLWRAEISELSAAGAEDTGELERCGDFFINQKGRFCSEACRTRAFQIAKQLKDPNYLAEKQRRYRARKSIQNK